MPTKIIAKSRDAHKRGQPWKDRAHANERALRREIARINRRKQK